MSRKHQPPEWPARAISLDEMTELEVMGYTNEAQFQAWVLREAAARGWDKRLVYHPVVSRLSQSGWPDLVLIRPPRMLFWELKGPTGTPTESQERWISAMQACGQEARFVWPKDWRYVIEALEREGTT